MSWEKFDADRAKADRKAMERVKLGDAGYTKEKKVKKPAFVTTHYVRSDASHARPEGSPKSENVTDRVMQASRHIAAGQGGIARVNLSEVRKAVSDVPRHEVDAALLHLHRSSAVTLYPQDNGRERTSVDDEAAVNVAGRPHHMLYLGQKE
jgi:hypothetical protein